MRLGKRGRGRNLKAPPKALKSSFPRNRPPHLLNLVSFFLPHQTVSFGATGEGSRMYIWLLSTFAYRQASSIPLFASTKMGCAGAFDSI